MSWNKLRIAQRQASSGTSLRPITWFDVCAALVVVPGILLVAWASQFVQASAGVHELAKFVHLAALVLGFGAVLAVDWFGIRWLLGLTSLESLVATAGALAIPVWCGLAGLVLSGLYLSPDLTSPHVRAKIVLVAGAGLVGIAARATSRQLRSARPPLVIWALGLATASQICWWGATVIGFLGRT